MRTIWFSRRTFVALVAILTLLVLGLTKDVDVSMAISAVAVAVAGSNAWEGIKNPPKPPEVG